MNNIAQEIKDLVEVGFKPIVFVDSPTFATNVVDFNQRVLNVAQRQIGMLSQAELDISKKCLIEELQEFSEAAQQGDLIGMVDALIDLKYFATGVLYKMGLTAPSIDACEQAVHDANMEKKLGVNARRGDGSAADAVKPADWVGPEERIGKVLDAQMAVQLCEDEGCPQSHMPHVCVNS